MDNKPTLYVFQGLPASGKTTAARKMVEEAEGNTVRVNKDDLRKMMDNGEFSKPSEARVLRIRDAVIIDALVDGKNVIVDDTNFAPYHLKRFQEIAQAHNAKLHLRFFDTDVSECIIRNSQRGDESVPTHVITDMYEKYLKPLEEADNGSEEELPECIIVDVDGTLAHINDANPRNIYDASRAMEDVADDAVSSVVGMAYNHGYHVVVLTGRQRLHQQVTEDWLEANGINYDEIHSRPIGDRRADTIVKQEMYERYVKGKFNVKYVIDDRPSVCRMWRKLGLKVLQVGDPHVEF